MTAARLGKRLSGERPAPKIDFNHMKVPLLALASLAGALLLPAGAHAQLRNGASSGYDTPAANPNAPGKNLGLYDLNGDGKIDDWERDKVNLRLLSEMDLNHDGRIDAKDVKLAKERMRLQKAERAAEIKKYDLNGDGKLDDRENALRLEDEARERAKQKPSQAAIELSKPIIAY